MTTLVSPCAAVPSPSGRAATSKRTPIATSSLATLACIGRRPPQLLPHGRNGRAERALPADVRRHGRARVLVPVASERAVARELAQVRLADVRPPEHGRGPALRLRPQDAALLRRRGLPGLRESDRVRRPGGRRRRRPLSAPGRCLKNSSPLAGRRSPTPPSTTPSAANPAKF